MFIKITKKKYNGKLYEQATLVETIRDGNKTIQKQLKNLGVIKTKEDRDRIQQLIDSAKNGKILVLLDEANEIVYEYGVNYIVSHIWKELGLNKFFENKKARIDINELLCLLISHRLHNYGSCNLSEREAHRWITTEAFTSSHDVSLQHYYRVLHFAFHKKDEIEKHLCDTLNSKKEVIFYDLTSSYLEGEYEHSKMVDFGYNRDKKRGKMQIVLGLLLSDHLPLGHKVWEGNTTDKSTLKDAITHAQRLGITKFIFVADRGLITEKNIEFLESKQLQYIIATQRRKSTLIKKLMLSNTNEPVTQVYCDSKKKRIYYLCYNKDVKKERLNELQEIRQNFEHKLSLLKKTTERKVFSLLGKASKFFKMEFKPSFSFTLNQNVWEYEKAIAGKYILITNNNKLTAKEVQNTYKQLAEIEQAFGELKHLEDMRPIFHKKDDAIRAHIFLCVLTLLIERFIHNKIKTTSAREILAEMKTLKLSKIKGYYVRTELTKEQQEILVKLGVEEPPKVM